MQNLSNQSSHESAIKGQNNSSKSNSSSLLKKLKTKQFWFWLSPLIITIGIMIAVIIIVSQSVKFFQLLFTSINNELYARYYLKHYYTRKLIFIKIVDMALLYLSIIGFMIVLVNSVIYIGKFLTDKTKLTYFHIVFYLTYNAVGIAMFVKKAQYKTYIQNLSQKDLTSSDCSLIMFECIISKNFGTYQGSFMSFFIAFCILFLFFMVLFHLNAKWELEEIIKPKRKEINNQSNIF